MSNLAPEPEHDACGVGFLADLNQRASHDVIRMSLEAAASMAHRGARAADGRTGDGAGLLVESPRAINDIVRAAGRAELGEENVVEHDIVMWAEDMSFMQNERPGAYFIVGSRGGPDTAFPHHNARFDIDERALAVGYEMMVRLGLGETGARPI